MSNKFKRRATATILHEGWEMDNTAWVEEDKKGNRKFYTTNHGRVVPLTGQYLKEKIKETRNSLEELEYLLGLMQNDGNR